MKEGLIIEGISFQGHCGVTKKERKTPQPLLADLEFGCSAEDAIHTDNINKTIDYAKVASRVLNIGATYECSLIETLADHISKTLMAEFPIKSLHIWLRKASPPLNYVSGSVGVRLTYPREQHQNYNTISSLNPSPFLTAHAGRISKGKVLDVAAGQGRNAILLASMGYEVLALDRDEESLNTLFHKSQHLQLSNLKSQQIDLEENHKKPPSFGRSYYDGIVVFFYLFRPLFPSLIRALKPSGILIYETFLIDNHEQFQHPHRKEFCLDHNELLKLTQGLKVLHYEEGPAANCHSPITARLVAKKIV